MNILIIHNVYSQIGGEERAVEMQRALLESAGHSVSLYLRNYNEIKRNFNGKVKSLFSSIKNRNAAEEIDTLIEQKAIDLVIIHNLYPIISPYFLSKIKRRKVKIVMILHNYRLLCPTGLFLRSATPCERCASGVRELNCAIYRCEGSFMGSIAYALRGFAARKSGYITDNVDKFIATTQFQKDKLIGYGFESSKIDVLHNFTDFEPLKARDHQRDGSVLYVGRLSKEKGYELLFKAAEQLPDITFKVAGRYEESQVKYIPSNIILLGEVGRERLTKLYQTSSLLLYPTLCYESFPLTILEAGVNMLPILASNIGATASIVKSEVNGLLFDVGSVDSLVEEIRKMLYNKELQHKLAQNNFNIITTRYGKDSYISTFNKILKTLCITK